MLFNVSYKQQNETKQLLVSGASMSNVLVYCDANNLTPLTLSVVTPDILINQPSLEYSYTVNLIDQSDNQSSTIIYDTYNNVISWISSQTGKTVLSLTKQTRGFVQA